MGTKPAHYVRNMTVYLGIEVSRKCIGWLVIDMYVVVIDSYKENLFLIIQPFNDFLLIIQPIDYYVII